MKQSLGGTIRKIRNEKKMTQAKLAQICNLDEDYVSKIKRGVRQPSLHTLFAIADALNTPLANIIKEVDILRKQLSKTT